jgi:uncharacterized membrane protein
MKRLILPDLFKGLAALFMVQIHITELFLDAAGRESLFGKTSLFLGGPFAAVVFMLVMGYFIARNKSSMAQNMFRGVQIFILGFLLNFGLNFHLLLKIRFADWPYNPLEYLFGIDILYLAGMSIVVLAVLKSLKKGQEAVALILLVSVIALTGFMNLKLTADNHYYILPFIAGNYSWSYFPLFPWLAYPLAGFIFARYEPKIKLFYESNKTASISIISAVALGVFLYAKQGINTTINLPAYYHHTFLFILWAIGLSALWALLLKFVVKLLPGAAVTNFFCYIGKNITLFYVIQWLIIGNIATAIYQTQTIGQYWYWFTGIFAASVMLTFLIDKIRLKLFRKPKETVL